MSKKFGRQNAVYISDSLSIFGALVLIMVLPGCEPLTPDAHENVVRIVRQIQKADYEGDQAGMQKGYDKLAPFLATKELASKVRYWRGFAMWRRAMNGFNDSVDPKELEQDLKLALEEFRAATAIDPAFVDAKIATISCLGYTAFINRADQARAREFIGQMLPLVEETRQAAPDNPRFLWVLGPILWNIPPERGGGQGKAIESYERGLAWFEKNNNPPADGLEPSWGKPELMMSLAYSHLNKDQRDVNAAERYARSALEIVPYWHYVRDILLRQIVDAKMKAM